VPEPIVSKAALLRIYDDARRSLDPLSAIEHTAGVTGLDLVVVESTVQGREAQAQAMELLG
jgi:hypothetical protein